MGIGKTEELAETMSYLLDYALVVPTDILYRISEPIRDAAYRTFGGFRLDHARVVDLLEDYLKDTDEDEARIQLAQNLFRATLLANRVPTSKAVGLASDLISLTTQAYHDQDYENALRFGKEAIAIRPESLTVRRFLAQAYVRKEMYPEAEEQINAMLEQGHLGEAFYVKGFMARRRRQYEKAIEFYSKSIEYGRGGPAIHRELASCYFQLGDLPSAQQHINLAQNISPHNAFIVDLQCTIAIRTGNLPAAEKSLAVLEKVDPGGFYDHRRSTFEQAKGNALEALEYAQLAVEAITHPPFEVLANLANCQIEMGQYPEAGTTLHNIGKRFAGTHHDAKVGLRCKLELRRGDTTTAEALWNQLHDKKSGVSRGLRLALLNRKADNAPLSQSEAAEQANLSEALQNTDWKRNERLLGSVLSSDE